MAKVLGVEVLITEYEWALSVTTVHPMVGNAAR